MAYDRFLIDKRVVDRNIAKGLVDPNEYKRIVESLPDSEQNCVHVSLDGEAAAAAPAVSEDSGASDSDFEEDDEDDEGLDDQE
jgi:hypothetical protein